MSDAFMFLAGFTSGFIAMFIVSEVHFKILEKGLLKLLEAKNLTDSLRQVLQGKRTE